MRQFPPLARRAESLVGRVPLAGRAVKLARRVKKFLDNPRHQKKVFGRAKTLARRVEPLVGRACSRCRTHLWVFKGVRRAKKGPWEEPEVGARRSLDSEALNLILELREKIVSQRNVRKRFWRASLGENRKGS